LLSCEEAEVDRGIKCLEARRESDTARDLTEDDFDRVIPDPSPIGTDQINSADDQEKD
jgi:hypothetical protein